jgi:hypothetical protein
MRLFLAQWTVWLRTAVMSRLSCRGCPVPTVLSRLSCHGCSVPVVLSVLTGLAILFFLSCLVCNFPAVLSQLSFPCYPAPPFLSLLLLSLLSHSDRPVLSVSSMPRPNCPVLAIPYQLSCPGCSYKTYQKTELFNKKECFSEGQG